ncbi:MAG: CAP domain-containing protein [Pseudomonadota bacterium]
MRFGRTFTSWRLLALGLTAPLVIGATGIDADFNMRILAAHNEERGAVGVAPLRWDPALARDAQRWADTLAASGRFRHSPQSARADVGENLWAGTKGYFRPENMVEAWVREKRFFKQGAFPHNSTTGKVEDVGHYTQLIWRQTGEVGCAKAANSDEEFLVCRYANAGNYIGESPI